MQGLQVSSDGNALAIPSSSAVAQSLHPGDILVSGPTPSAPYGLLVKVLTVVPGASTGTVTVADVSLEDAIQRVNINTSFPLGSTNVVQKSTRNVNSSPTQALSLADSCSSQRVKYSYNFDLPVTGQQDGNYITPSKLDGSVEICPTFVFQLQMDFFEIKSLTLAIQMGEHVAVNSEIGELIGISKEFDAAPIQLPSFSVVVPGLPFPIWFTPQLVFYASANGDVMAALSAGLAQDASLKIGASYTNGAWAAVNDRTNNFGYAPPSLDGGLSIKGALGARVDFLIYRTVGPSIGVDIYSQFDANTAENPWWTWTAGIEGPIAFHVQVFGHSLADYDVGDVFNFSWVLKQASSGFLVSDVTPVLNSVLPPSAQVASADVPLSLSGSNFVPDSIASFNGTFLPTNFIDSNDLAATLPGGLLYMDGAFPITVTNPDISGAISGPFDFSVTGAVVRVLPSTAQLPATSVQQFGAVVLGPSNTVVNWGVNGVVGGNSTVGTISASGLYTAPSAVPNPATVTVTATSQAVPSASGSASVTIGPYTEKPLYSFTSLTDGAAPSAPLILASDGYYYGTAQIRRGLRLRNHFQNGYFWNRDAAP
jgi:hypothetical protein